MSPDCLRPRGLREEKKEQTRSALSDAALDLVSRHGYEATTVEAIARAAGVSVRTFHNYFPGKAATLAHLAADLTREYGELLREQPDDLRCSDALRDAWSAMLDRYRDDVAKLVALIDAIESNPDLRRYLDENHPDTSAVTVEEIARRLGTDSATSAIPHVAAGIAFSVPVMVTRLHGSPGFTDRSLDSVLDEAFSALPMLATAPLTDSPTSPY